MLSRAYNARVMTNQCKLAIFVALFGALPAMAQSGAIDAKQAVVIVQHDGSEGDVRVNGVPVLHFASDRSIGPMDGS